MTQTQTDSSRRYSRRGVMRRTALGVGAAATLGGAASASVAAVDWETAGKYAAAALIGGPAAAAVVAYGALTDGPDDSQVADSLDWQAHVDEFTRAREDQLLLDQTLDSLGRDVQLIDNKAREEAIFRIYEQGVDGGTQTDATNAAETAINEAYAVVQKSLINSWNIRAARAKAVNELMPSEIYSWDGSTSNNDGTSTTYPETEVTLFDGTTAIEQTVNGYSSWYPFTNPGNNGGATYTLKKPDPANYETADEPLDISDPRVVMLGEQPWASLWSDLDTAHTNMMNEVSAMVDSYFQPAQDGEIDLTDVRGPAHLTETAQNASDYQEATMALRAMGFSIADQTSVVSFTQDGTTYELDGRLARTVQDPNDLPVGTELDPSDITGSVYGAFNIKNDAGERVGEIFEITNPFTIETAEGESSVSFQTRTLVGADSTLTNEEIQQIFKENYEANKDATENVYDTATTSTSGGGGGGFLAGSDQNWGLIAAGAGVAAIGWGYITGDDQ